MLCKAQFDSEVFAFYFAVFAPAADVAANGFDGWFVLFRLHDELQLSWCAENKQTSNSTKQSSSEILSCERMHW